MFTPEQYCEEVLPKVSRTFALNIKLLRGDLRRAVLLSYLICRILDTVEDSPALHGEKKQELLLEFNRIIKSDDWQHQLNEWIKLAHQAGIDGSNDDIDLLNNSKLVVSELKTLPVQYQRFAHVTYQNMAVGMARYVKRFAHKDIALLTNLRDLKEYCYYVAGTVGEFLVESFCHAYPMSKDAQKKLRANAISFGLGLQMTNIAKDVMKDRNRGWTYIPNSLLRDAGLTPQQFLAVTESGHEQKILKVLDLLIKEATKNLKNALELTLSVPRRHVRLRLFCLWPLWMALETLRVLKGNLKVFKSKAEVKISRAQVKAVLFKTTCMTFSNSMLRREFSKLELQLTKA